MGFTIIKNYKNIANSGTMDNIQYEIIEEYPKDKYLPSYLLYARYKGKIFHVLFAIDVTEDNVRIVTAYYPDKKEWGEDLKTRR